MDAGKRDYGGDPFPSVSPAIKCREAGEDRKNQPHAHRGRRPEHACERNGAGSWTHRHDGLALLRRHSVHEPNRGVGRKEAGELGRSEWAITTRGAEPGQGIRRGTEQEVQQVPCAHDMQAIGPHHDSASPGKPADRNGDSVLAFPRGDHSW